MLQKTYKLLKSFNIKIKKMTKKEQTQRKKKENLKSLRQINKLKEDLIWEKYVFRTSFGLAILFLLPLVLEGFFGTIFMLLIGFLSIKSALNMAGLFRIEDKIKNEH